MRAQSFGTEASTVLREEAANTPARHPLDRTNYKNVLCANTVVVLMSAPLWIPLILTSSYNDMERCAVSNEGCSFTEYLQPSAIDPNVSTIHHLCNEGAWKFAHSTTADFYNSHKCNAYSYILGVLHTCQFVCTVGTVLYLMLASTFKVGGFAAERDAVARRDVLSVVSDISTTRVPEALHRGGGTAADQTRGDGEFDAGRHVDAYGRVLMIILAFEMTFDVATIGVVHKDPLRYECALVQVMPPLIAQRLMNVTIAAVSLFLMLVFCLVGCRPQATSIPIISPNAIVMGIMAVWISSEQVYSTNLTSAALVNSYDPEQCYGETWWW